MLPKICLLFVNNEFIDMEPCLSQEETSLYKRHGASPKLSLSMMKIR